MQGLPARPDFSPTFSEPDSVQPPFNFQHSAIRRRETDCFCNSSGSNVEFNYVRFIAFGIILIWMLRYRPGGLLPESRLTTGAHDVLRRALEK